MGRDFFDDPAAHRLVSASQCVGYLPAGATQRDFGRLCSCGEGFWFGNPIANIGAFIIRRGFGGILYYNKNKGNP